MGSVPELGRSPRGGHGNPLQYSSPENPMDRGTWQATVHRVAQSWIWLKRPSVSACSHTHTESNKKTIYRSMWKWKSSSLSRVQLFVTPWTVAHQAPVSLGFSRQEYWSGLPCPPLGDLPNPGIEPTFPVSPALQMDSLPLSLWGSPVRLFTVSHFERVVFPVQPLTDCTYSSFLESQI